MVTTRNYFAALVNLAEDEATSSHGEAKEEDANAGAVLQQAIALSLAEAPQRPAVQPPNGAPGPVQPAAQAQPPASGAQEDGVSSAAAGAAPSANGTAAEPRGSSAAAAGDKVAVVDVNPAVVTFERQGRAPRRQRDKSKLAQALVWLDLEMTGLDPVRDTIMEIACLVSDGTLEQVVEGPEIAIHCSEDVLASMNEWCVEHHGPSGLTERCRQSETTLAQAEQQVLAFLRQHVEPKEARLAGNSVHVDVTFLKAWMPDLAAYLHYRIVDVSTVAELCHRWYPGEYKRAPRKLAAHTAMADIKESLEQLRYYKTAIFKHPRRAV